jgi:hypothetical protein
MNRAEVPGTEIACSGCEKPFLKHQQHGRRCKSCLNAYCRKKRRETGNRATRKYEKTKKGFLMRMYRNMKSRITGIQRHSAHLYDGKELLSKEEFYKWAWANPDFHELFETWEKSGYERNIVPSIDRIHPDEGYYLMNMQFVTAGENSKRAAAWRWYGKII